jgi:hypothetical protein
MEYEDDVCYKEWLKWSERNNVPQTEDNAWYAWSAAWRTSAEKVEEEARK